MNTVSRLVFSVLLVLVPASVSAQAFSVIGGGTITPTYTNYYNQAYNTGYGAYSSCVSITHDLARGSRDANTGGDVSRLQTFLVSQNYPGSGSWMITSYFGAATEQAVLNFQSQHGLPRTGVVDASTRAALGGCLGITSATPTYSYSTPFTTFGSPYVNSYSGACGFGSVGCSYAVPSISGLSASSGAVGTVVTVYGSGFSASNNAVHFGPGVIASVYSFDGRSLSFTVPSAMTGYGSGQTVLGTYNVSVTNAQGQISNQLPFTVTSLSPEGTPGVSFVNPPTTLSAGIAGTWGFRVTGQTGAPYTITIRWGDENMTNLGATVQSFTLSSPQTLSFNHAYNANGTYTITVTVANAVGTQYSASAIVVVSGNTQNTGTPVLSTISPAQGRTGTLVVLQGANFAPSGNIVHFGTGGSINVSSSNGGTVIYYTIPYSVTPCDLTIGSSCAGASPIIPGVYQVSVQNGSGTSAPLSFTVTQY